MNRSETEQNWLVGFDLDGSSYHLLEPEPFLNGEEVVVSWPHDGYQCEIEFINARAEEGTAIRRATLPCEPGPILSNRQLVADHCEISNPSYLTAWGDETTNVWSDGPTDYHVWACDECGTRQVDSPQDAWIEADVPCGDCGAVHPLPWEDEATE